MGRFYMWKYKGQDLKDEDIPEDAFGFVYRITYDPTGKFYIGKKSLQHRTKKRLSKKARAGTRKRIVRGTKDSGWKNYWSSCIALKEDVKLYGEDKFTREILQFTFNRAETTYYEVHFQVVEGVMFKESYNGWVSGKVWKCQLKNASGGNDPKKENVT